LLEISKVKVWKDDIIQLEAFEREATLHKTLVKPTKLKNKINPFKSKYGWKYWKKEVLGGKTSLNLSGSNFSQAVESQFKSIETAMSLLVKQVNNNNDSITRSMRMLEFEKNKLKRELGNCDNIQLNAHFNSPSVWLTLLAMLDYLKEPECVVTSATDDNERATIPRAI